MSTVLAFSGGKDSTAMLLRMEETGERPDVLLITPTGNELPEMQEHWMHISEMVGVPLTIPAGVPTLAGLIRGFGALPNWRQRWCTRQIKILPALAFMRRRPQDTLCVGLRADEEEREGIYGEFRRRFPLREYGWGIEDVRGYLCKRGVTIPKRTDCAWCYGQRISEWFDLWRNHPDLWMEGEEMERMTGHTFRSAGRDTWPASMEGLRSEFEAGRKVRGEGKRLECRVCSL